MRRPSDRAECFDRLLETPEILEGLRQFNHRDHPERRDGEAAARYRVR